MRTLAIRLAAPLLLLTTLGAARPATPAHFSMILTLEGRTWRATCETGCRWNALSARGGWLFGSTVVIDGAGVSTDAAGADPTTAFAFRLEPKGGNGWEATPLRGTGWTKLGFTCGELTSCRARVTESGVTSLP